MLKCSRLAEENLASNVDLDSCGSFGSALALTPWRLLVLIWSQLDLVLDLTMVALNTALDAA